jgi:hypothetical protein
MRRPAFPSIITFGAVGGVIAVTLWQLHPSLLLSNTTITGGDTGAHVGLAGFLKSNLLPHGQVTGWDPGAYDGFPLNTLYFPLPDFLAAAFGYVIPFNIAFKLVTTLGSLSLPIAAWLFGRLAGLERPRPAVLAIFTLPYLFEQSYEIYGGNLYSTMAGEYAFSLGLSFALVFLGLCLRGMRTGRNRAWAAVLLGVCILCHVLTAFFALAGALVVFLLAGPNRKRLWWMVSAVGGGLLLVSWWVVPFALDQVYATNMGWLNVSTYLTSLFPAGDIWAIVLACLGAILAVVMAVVRRQGGPLALAVLGIASAFMVRYDPQWTLYNVRFLPFYFLCVYLLAGYVVAEALIAVAVFLRWLRLQLWRDSLPAAVYGTWAGGPGMERGPGDGSWAPPPSTAPFPKVPSPGLLWTEGPAGGRGRPPPWPAPSAEPVHHPAAASGASTSTTVAVAEAPQVEGGGDRDGEGAPAWQGAPAPPSVSWPRPHFGPWAPGAILVPVAVMLIALAIVVPPLVPSINSKVNSLFDHTFTADPVPSWANWNYSGYQNTPGAKELYDGVIPTMNKVGREYGCGRAMWEYNSSLNRFGTPESLMLLPYWTNNCIDSIEGVLFESSATTPYHFINQAELSAAPSEAVVASTTGIQYGPLDVPLGVQHLQLLGIKYFMASSPTVEAEADADPNLTLVAKSGPWHTYYGSDIETTWKVYEVHDAAMVKPLPETPDVLTTTKNGQGSWLPVAQKWYADPGRWNQQLVVGGLASWKAAPVPSRAPAGRALPPARVSDIRTGVDSLSFHVSRTGVPVVVDISYFPNWHVTGAQGPWRAEPNLMVVDPTSHAVTLTYGASKANYLGWVLTLVGIVVLVVLIRRRSFVSGWSPMRTLHEDGPSHGHGAFDGHRPRGEPEGAG